MAEFELPPHYGQGLTRHEPIMVGSSDDEDEDIQHRRTRRLGGPQGTPIPRQPPRGLRIFSPPPPPPIPFGVLQALPLFDEIGLDQHELMRLLLDRPVPRVFAPIARSRPPEEPYDVRMTHASARPRLGFTFDFEQPEEEEEKSLAPRVRVRVPVKFKQTIEIPDSPTLGPGDKGKQKAKELEPEDLGHKEIIEIYSDDEEGNSIASTSQSVSVPGTKLTSVLICAGCRRPLRTGGDRLWALRCGHMIDSRCYDALSRPQFSSLPLLARLGSPPHKRRKTKAGKGKGKGVMESHEWACPVRDCALVHKSERMAGEEEWVPTKDAGAIKVFI